jgi:hypothetical protein
VRLKEIVNCLSEYIPQPYIMELAKPIHIDRGEVLEIGTMNSLKKLIFIHAH